jgi:hypothetical protein
MTQLRPLLVTLAALSLCLSPHAYAISAYDLLEPTSLNLSLGTGFEFETGEYGTNQSVDSWKIPLLLEWAPHERFGLALEIPYVRQSSSATTVMLGGMRTPLRRGSGTPGGSGSTGTTRSQAGLGDITLNASITLLPETEPAPRLLALLYAKLPTADEQQGLGTGEFDWGGGLGIGRKFDNWSTYAEARYILPGSSETYAPDAYWEWLAALSYRINSSLRPGLAISGGSAPFDGADNPLEIKARLSGLSGEQTSYSLYLARGLSDASPDWGVGIFGYLDF